jgi:3-methyl-2-oxobutanoate hydroxymethyltransferase
MTHKISVPDILKRKHAGPKITVLTAYDFAFARLVDQAGIDIVLVGDSLGMVILGYESTVSVTVPEMLHHLKAVRRGTKHALLVLDMPYGSYETPAAALRNARTFVKEGGAQAVKLEGGFGVLKQVRALTEAGIQVMGHLGMLPQSIQKLGGYKVQGKTHEAADRILKEAKALEEAGAFSIVLECVPRALAKRVTKAVGVPTIGIGAGPDTDGQVLVIHDLLGFESAVKPRFVRRYAQFGKEADRAIRRYRDDVLKGKFPSERESY